MRFSFILFLLLTAWAKRRKSLDRRVDIADDRIRRQAVCTSRLSPDNSSTPAHISADACCNSQLETVLQSSAPNNLELLGDAAKLIQKTIQQQLGHSYEVFISEGDIAVSSHYKGQQMCKLSQGNYHLLAYQTPIAYNINDLATEASLAAIDAQEALGSTPEGPRGHFQDYRLDHLAGEETAAIQPRPRIARARELISKYGNNTFLRQGPGVSNNSRLPVGTYCSRETQGGSKCCSGALHEIMENVLGEVATSPEFDDSGKATTVVANLVKRRVQQRFGRVFEVIVSRDDFHIATHQVGDYTCKFESHGMHLLTYETPEQSRYFPFAAEERISSSEDLALPGQRPSTSAMLLENTGNRAGFPTGSHCDEGERLGSRCCNLPLFNSMHRTIMNMKTEDTFNTFDRRTITKRIRDNAETDTGLPLEVIVAGDDFVVSSHGNYMNSCKFRIDQYYIMAWETPENWAIHTDLYADNGFTSFIECAQPITAIEGVLCCNGYLRYTMTRAIDESSEYSFTRQNTQHVLEAVVNATETTFNTTLEVIVSRGDFVWLAAGYETGLVCKIDQYQFHALVFQINYVFPNAFQEQFGSVFFPDPPAVFEIAQPPVQQIIQPPIGQFNQPPIGQFNQPPIGQFIQPSVPQVFQQIPPSQYIPPVPYSPPGWGYCFSEDTTVITPKGRKKISSLQTGDYVQTANSTDVYFTLITSWMHREKETISRFLKIIIDDGKSLQLTAKHLIYRRNCNNTNPKLPEIGEEVFADELKLDDCVIVFGEEKWQLRKVVQIKEKVLKGIYAPLTPNGRIVANDILASCYSEIKGPVIQQSFFTISSFIRNLFIKLTSWINNSEIGMPFSIETWRDIMKIIVPITSFDSLNPELTHWKLVI